ncbi:restriction endonuclease subunit S [Glutamicibacter ardleyensis]|uniref:restriction endonuclease subunit S n=1 Tax=Glutamicibacter ardleyensis TaxID=225894 RepID=UPI003FB8EBAB
MNEWPIKSFGDVVDLQRGHDLPAQERNAGRVPIIGSFGITGTHNEAKYSGPGVAIGRSGAAIGTATYVDEPYWPLNTCLFVSDFKGNDPRWVYRLLDQLDFTQFNSGSAQPSLNRNFLRDIPVSTPTLKEQQAIAEVLSALDDKIAANTKLARKAFNNAVVVHESTLAHESQSVPLSTIATTVLGGTPSKTNDEYWANGTVPWINSGKANEDRIIEPSAMITEKALTKSAAKLMPVGATVLAITGATLGQVARLELEAAGNQSLIGVWSGQTNHNSWLHFAIRREIPQLLKKATGAAQQHVNKQDVDSLLIPTPPDGLVRRAGKDLTVLLESASAADRESVLLRKTRDALLPQLMSGKLRVKAAEKLVAATL